MTVLYVACNVVAALGAALMLELAYHAARGLCIGVYLTFKLGADAAQAEIARRKKEGTL